MQSLSYSPTSPIAIYPHRKEDVQLSKCKTPDKNCGGRSALPLHDCSNQLAANAAAVTSCVSRIPTSITLSSDLNQIYLRNNCNLEEIAKNSEELSEFLEYLVKEPATIVSNVLKQFAKKKYNTSVSVVIDSFHKEIACNLRMVRQFFPTIDQLVIEDSNINCKQLQEILTSVNQIKRLGICNAEKVSQADFAAIRYPAMLSVVQIENCSIDDAGLARLLQCCKNLKELALESCPSCTFQLKSSNLFELEQLSLSNCGVTELGIQSIGELFPDLKTLKLYHCEALKDDVFTAPSLPPSLYHLDLVGLDICDSFVAAIGKKLRMLEALVIADCPKLSSQAFVGLNFTESLTELVFQNVPINGQSIHEIIKRLQGLIYLNLDGCQEITKDDFLGLPYPESLEEMNLAHTNIDERGLHALAVNTPHLARLRLDGCKNLKSSFCEQDINHEQLEELLAIQPVTSRASLTTSLEEAIFGMELDSK